MISKFQLREVVFKCPYPKEVYLKHPKGKGNNYRPRSEGDNALGSVRLSVRLCALSRLNLYFHMIR